MIKIKKILLLESHPNLIKPNSLGLVSRHECLPEVPHVALCAVRFENYSSGASYFVLKHD